MYTVYKRRYVARYEIVIHINAFCIMAYVNYIWSELMVINSRSKKQLHIQHNVFSAYKKGAGQTARSFHRAV